MTMAERKSNITLRKDLALTGELLGLCYEDFGENLPRYNGTALYIISQKKTPLLIDTTAVMLSLSLYGISLPYFAFWWLYLNVYIVFNNFIAIQSCLMSPLWSVLECYQYRLWRYI